MLLALEDVGMWECVGFYPVMTSGGATNRGLYGSSDEPSMVVKHVPKASTSDTMKDCYSIGIYDPTLNAWLLDEEGLDVGVGLSMIGGDSILQRCFTMTWSREGFRGDRSSWWIVKLLISPNVELPWPVEEVKAFRGEENNCSGYTVSPGSTLEFRVSRAVQLDMEAEFLIDREALETMNSTAVTYECARSFPKTNLGNIEWLNIEW